MGILKCKMCGGNIEVSQDMTIGTCMYCGSTMTIPRIESDKKLRLFNRANEYRINNEFDKAYSAYETIVNEDEQESEAYWGMLLSEYGVEYVEDPATKKRVPTCHRTQMHSIKTTTNYALARKYADAERRFMYEDEAEVIDKLQKKIIAVSSKEEPYDVFICYKETDEANGERTEDSVLAQEIYDQLTEKGLRVFFSRITLEDKLGKDYEPYIYAALTSAKVMVVVTTSNENSEAVWVKNEWMRFMNFMNEDKEKVLIPAYKDMSAYELPGELTKFQAQDMNKVGAVQDLVHAVTKLFTRKKNEDRLRSIEELKDFKEKTEQKEKKRKKRKRTVLLTIMIILMAAVLTFMWCSGGSDFKAAKDAFAEGEFTECAENLESVLNAGTSHKFNIFVNEKKLNELEMNILEWQIEDIQRRYDELPKEDIAKWGKASEYKSIDKETRKKFRRLDEDVKALLSNVDSNNLSMHVHKDPPDYYFYDPDAIDNEEYKQMLVDLTFIEAKGKHKFDVMGIKYEFGDSWSTRSFHW